MFDRTGSRKYLNGAERNAYLQAILNEPDAARRAFLLTMFYTGCRISEALRVTANRVDLAGKAIVFETLKQRKPGKFRSVLIPDSLVELLREVLATVEPLALVWAFSRSTGYRGVKAKMALAAVAGCMACPKGVRHGYAVACIGHNIPVTKVQKWMGHARVETTAIYLDVGGDEERDLAKRLWAAG